MADKSEHFINVPRRERELAAEAASARVDLLNNATLATRYSLATSIPEKREEMGNDVQAQAERQAQAALAVANVPVADSRLWPMGGDGASITGARIEPTYSAPMAQQHVEDTRAMTGITETGDAMEANAATPVEPTAEYGTPLQTVNGRSLADIQAEIAREAQPSGGRR